MSHATERELADLREAVRGFLDIRSPESVVRRLMETEDGFDRTFWTEMATAIGLQGLTIPAVHGGSEATLVELTVVLEEMGRSLLCAPFLATSLATATLLAAGDPTTCAAYLPGIADGSTVATIALAGPDGVWDGISGDVVAEETSDGWLLSGTASHVIDGATADLALFAASTDHGLGLFAVSAPADGLERIPLQVLDPTRKQSRLSLHRTPATAIGDPGSAAPVVQQVLDFAAIALAAEQLGGARECLGMAVAYAKTRVQFGRTIGSFQAIKHKCAEMLVEVESASSALAIAVDAVVEHRDASVAASLAKASCSEAYMRAASENIQIHGGVGFTWEHPAHLYYKRARSSLAMLGDPYRHRAYVAELLKL